MKMLLMILGVVFVVGCGSDEKAPVQVLERHKIDSVINKVSEKYPNYKLNKVSLSKASKYFEDLIDSNYADNQFSDIPLVASNVVKNKKGDGWIIYFFKDRSLIKEDEKISPISRLSFDYVAYATEKQAEGINEKSIYYVTGKKIIKLDQAAADVLLSYTNYGVETNITQDDNYNSVYNLNAGVFFFELVSAKLKDIK